MKTIRLSGICPNSLVNGEGMRKVYFAQGCKHNCKGCFSPFTHNFNGGEERELDDEIIETLQDPLIKGVTFSGGDPFEQADEFNYMANVFKYSNLSIWCYTGYTFEEIMNSDDNDKIKLLQNVDVLVDGKFMEEYVEEGLRYRGSKNQRIIDVQRTICEGKIVLLHFDDIGYLEEE